MQLEITDDLEAMLEVLPPRISDVLRRMEDNHELLEVVMDLGRSPEARLVEREVVLDPGEVGPEILEDLVSRIGNFGDDNRAGIERTLHRISAIRNREGEIVGLTLRVGRAVYGTIDIIRDIVESGKSILLLGRPGVGKTTMLREVARVLGEKSRVVIVDTSNEIAGDGDIPHPAIGRARRMQVPAPNLQHEVMIEAVENHMPEVIIIDEIGRELEAHAARTIAERGVQLVGTAHGNTLENLLMNPTLSDLVGGIESVTLSDEEARRRGSQKAVLERRAPPTFDVVVEIQERDRLAIRHDVAKAVDALLRGREQPAEVRYRDESGEIHRGEAILTQATVQREAPVPLKRLRVFPYGLNQKRLARAAQAMNVPLDVTDDLEEAETVLTLRNYYRKRPRRIAEAEERGIPVYVLRNNTLRQMEMALADLFGVEVETDRLETALDEAQMAIQEVLAGRRSVELSPQEPFIRRQQHELARQARLVSRSRGKEPRRRVRIYQSG